MSTHAGKSYEYNAICDICGFKKKNYQLRKRWDGFMVCDEDWETRNILDFYDTKNDTHLLPFTRPDNSDYRNWDPLIVGSITYTAGTPQYTYTNIGGIVNFTMEFQFLPSTSANFFSLVGTGTITLPITSVSAGTVSVRDSQGVRIRPAFTTIGAGVSTITWGAGTTTITIPANSQPYTVTIQGRYGV